MKNTQKKLRRLRDRLSHDGVFDINNTDHLSQKKDGHDVFLKEGMFTKLSPDMQRIVGIAYENLDRETKRLIDTYL